MDPVKQSEVLDDQGHGTGQVLTRGAVHEQELWHPTVNVWLLNSKGEVLLQQRGKKVEMHPELWDVAIGSHVRPGEDPTDSAVRCLQEELGVTITKDQLKHLFNIQSENPTQTNKLHRTLGHVFLLKRDMELSEFTYNTDKIALLAWKPLLETMGEVGGVDTSANYYPRPGNYFPQLFDAMQAEMQ